MTIKRPHPVDIHVGGRLRELRHLAGMTQIALADSVGLTFQQLQKYENATNRIAASRLWDLAGVLAAPVESFFPEQRGEVARGSDDPALAQWLWLYRRMPQEQREPLIRIVRVMVKEGLMTTASGYVIS